VPLQSLRDKRLHTSRVELSPWKNTITPHCRDRQLQPGDLRRNNEQDFVSLTAPGIHRCAGAVSRFDGQDPERDRSTFAAIDQATLARFISEGFFLSHIKRMRKIYAERRDFFIKQFNELLGDYFTLQVPEAGLNVVAWLRREEEFPMIRRLIFEIAVRPIALSFFCMEAKLKPAFVFGFAAWTPTQIRESLVKLASALKKKEI
jgi:hypothetical protein